MNWTKLKLNQKSQPNHPNPANKRPGWGRGRSWGHIIQQFFKITLCMEWCRYTYYTIGVRPLHFVHFERLKCRKCTYLHSRIIEGFGCVCGYMLYKYTHTLSRPLVLIVWAVVDLVSSWKKYFYLHWELLITVLGKLTTRLKYRRFLLQIVLAVTEIQEDYLLQAMVV